MSVAWVLTTYFLWSSEHLNTGIASRTGVMVRRLHWVWGTRSPGSEDSVRRFTQLAWKKKCVGTVFINSDRLGTTRIKKSAAQEIVSAAAAQTTIGKNLLKIPFIESNVATASKSGARKTLTI